jgi:hypothetical protein
VVVLPRCSGKALKSYTQRRRATLAKPSDDPDKGTLSEATARDPKSTPADRSVEALELPTVDRGCYAVADIHARGGMGRILAARDLRLDRGVAIKELIEASPAQEARFIREALVTARLQHPAIVPVYEAGRWPSGEPFYAMKMVSGRSLRELIQEAHSLEQRLAFLPSVIAVTDAIAYAHHEGIIHRDLKPSNIMVGPFGETLVIDWGLAKDVSERGLERDLGPYRVVASDLTLAGAVMGTPEYMPPEQARGEPVDARADVYALGAILYHVLGGAAPFAGESSAEILAQVRDGPAVPIEVREPRVPADLAAIVGRAMARRPEERYPTAQELDDDLRRFQAGQLVGAHRYSPSERAWRWIRRNRAAVAATVVGLLAAATLLGLWLRARWTASEQASQARRFGQEAERIDRSLREAYLLPLHDVRPEKSSVRVRMSAIEAEMQRQGSSTWASGHYALGRGHLALREYQKAREELEQAWGAGSQTPEVANALGTALGALYRQAIEEAQRIENKALRDARTAEIDRALRDPALTYARASGEPGAPMPAYVEGLIALYEKRYHDAAQKAREAFAGTPSLYEAKLLEADAGTLVADQQYSAGEYADSLAGHQRARDAYRAASDIARSDAAVYAGECKCGLGMLQVKTKQGLPSQETFDTALDACGKALQADPEHAETHATRSAILWRRAEDDSLSGKDRQSLFARAIESAAEAIKWAPDSAIGYKNKAIALEIRAEYDLDHGGDPRPSLSEAIANFERAVQIEPRQSDVWINLGMADETMGNYEHNHGRDPRIWYARSIEWHQKALSITPGFAQGYNTMGVAYKASSLYDLEQGADPRHGLDHAIESYRKALEINPKYMFALANLGNAQVWKATYELEQGVDPTTSLEGARKACEAAAALNPKAAFGIEMYLANANLIAARWVMKQGGSPKAAFRSAESALDASLTLNPDFGEAYETRADLHRWEALWRVETGQAVGEEIQRGLVATDKALSINPGSASALALRGALWLIRAHERPAGAGRAEAARLSIESLEAALRMNPLLKREFGPLLDEAREIDSAYHNNHRPS